MKISQIAILAAVIVGAGALGLQVMHDDGVLGAIREWTAMSPSSDGGTAPPYGATQDPLGDPASATTPRAARPSVAPMIEAAERFFERGNFDGATSNYMAARAVATDDGELQTVQKGLDRAIVLWAACQGAPQGTTSGAGAESEFTRLVQQAETAQTETAWFDALRFAAGAHLGERMAYVGTNLLDHVKGDGPVERICLTLIPTAQSRSDQTRMQVLSAALTRLGLSSGSPPATLTAGSDGTASGIGSTGGDNGNDNPGSNPPSTGERSGIRGSTARGIPFGAFSSATRTKLTEAVDWEVEGREEVALAAPDKPNRTDHARKAVKLLQQAREVFVAALDEDPKATGLDARIHEITRLISDLKKTLPITYK